MAKKTRRGQKQCPKCETWVKGTRAKSCPKCSHNFTNGQQKAVAKAAPVVAAVEAPAKPTNVVTLEQIKTVVQMVKTVGGFHHLREMLAAIKDVGGLKKFKDLLDAMEVAAP
jgi:hypothetical protein